MICSVWQRFGWVSGWLWGYWLIWFGLLFGLWAWWLSCLGFVGLCSFCFVSVFGLGVFIVVDCVDVCLV